VAAEGPVESQPPGAQHATEVTVAEDEHGVLDVTEAMKDQVGARRDLVRRLPLGAAVRPQIPSRALATDVLRRAALVDPVAELREVPVDLDAGLEPGALGGAARPQCGTRQDEREAPICEARPERVGLPETARREIDVGDARMPVRAGPLSLSMAREPDIGHADILL
jgi:hypothetical protein